MKNLMYNRKKDEILSFFKNHGAKIIETNNPSHVFIEMPDTRGFKFNWSADNAIFHHEWLFLSGRHGENRFDGIYYDIKVHDHYIEFGNKRFTL